MPAPDTLRPLGSEPHDANEFLKYGYRLSGELGRGSSGTVYRAVHVPTGIEVALKELRQFDAHDLYHLKREFRALCEIHHPNLAHMHELVAQPEHRFFTMELVDGPDLLEWVRGDAKPGTAHTDVCERLCDALAQLAGLLETMHGEGWIHRDIKPSNIRVSEAGRTVLLDFSLMATVRGAHSHPNEVAGTIAYMPPEAIWAPTATPGADMYSLGVMAFECLSGRRPFSGADIIHIDRLKRDGLPGFPETTPSWLEALVRRMTATEPADRPAAAEVVAELRRHASVQVTASRASPNLVGRADTLRGLLNAHRSRGASAPTVAVVTGPSGIGKTTLVRRMLEEAAKDPSTLILHGRCLPVATVPLPGLDGVADSLSQACQRLPDSELARCVPLRAAELLQLFPVLARIKSLAKTASLGSAALDLRERRRLGFEAFKQMLIKLSQIRRLIIGLDDIQWCDRDSLGFWESLLAEPIPLTFVVTSRGSEYEKQLVAGSRTTVHHFDLPPLSQAEIGRLVHEVAGSAVGDAVASVVRESHGNPFLALQLSHYVRDAQSPLRNGSSLSLGHVLRSRLGDLSAEAQKLLLAGCVAAAPTSLATLGTAMNLSSPARAAEELLRAGQLIEHVRLGPTMSVAPYHDRVREALISDTGPDALREVHLALALTLDADPNADPVATFWHWYGAGDEEMAGEHAIRAGDRLMEAMAFDQAIKVYSLGLDVRSRFADHWMVYERLGKAHELSGQGRLAGDAYGRAAQRIAEINGDPARRRELERRSAEALLRSGVVDEGYERLRPLLSVPELKLPCSTLRLFAVAMRQRLLAGLQWLSRARPKETSARTLERLDVLWSATVGTVWADLSRSTYYQSFHMRHALASNDHTHRARATATESCYLAAMGPKLFRPIFERRGSESLRVAREIGDPHLLALALTTSATMSFLCGDWGKAAAVCREAVKLIECECTAAAGWELSTSYILAALSLGMQGKLSEIESLRTDALEAARIRDDRLAETWVRVGLPNLTYLARGEPTMARHTAREAIASWSSSFEFSPLDFWGLVGDIQVDLYEGRPLVARERFEQAVRDIKGSLILHNRPLRSMFRYLDGATALAASRLARAKRERARLLRTVRRASRQLKRDSLGWPKAMSLALAAGYACETGSPRVALEKLAQAEIAFDNADMRLFRDAVRHHRARLSGEVAAPYESFVADAGAMSRCLVPIA